MKRIWALIAILCLGMVLSACDGTPSTKELDEQHQAFLEKAEEYTASRGKQYLRLDSAVGNKTLEDYYESRGYRTVGTCVDGLYEGILRQKKL